MAGLQPASARQRTPRAPTPMHTTITTNSAHTLQTALKSLVTLHRLMRESDGAFLAALAAPGGGHGGHGRASLASVGNFIDRTSAEGEAGPGEAGAACELAVQDGPGASPPGLSLGWPAAALSRPPRSAVFPDLSPVTLLPTLHPPAPRPQTGRFDFSEWVRAYGLYLEEQLEVFAALGWRVEQEQAGTESRMRSLT